MKDPRKEIYEALEASDNESLAGDLKTYLEKVIGKDEELKKADEAKKALETLQEQFDAQAKELEEAQANAGTADPNADLIKKLDALQKAFDSEQEEKKTIIKQASNKELSSSLEKKLDKVNPLLRSAIITAMKTDGYEVDGKTYKATNGENGMSISIDNVDRSFDDGLEDLFKSGLSEVVSGGKGGGFPSFDDKPKDPIRSMEDEINGALKG